MASKTFVRATRPTFLCSIFFFLFFPSSSGWGRKKSLSSPHFHAFSYTSCVDLTQLLEFTRVLKQICARKNIILLIPDACTLEELNRTIKVRRSISWKRFTRKAQQVPHCRGMTRSHFYFQLYVTCSLTRWAMIEDALFGAFWGGPAAEDPAMRTERDRERRVGG